MVTRNSIKFALLVCAAAAGLVAATTFAPSTAAEKKPLKIYVSTGFEGNTWMDASTNLLRAIAKTKAYKDRVTLEIQSARGDAQTQQQQINAMTQAGADIILAWPISPTALNRAVRAACQKGVTFFTWDAEVTEPCAHYVGIDQEWAGAGPAEWLAQKLNGKGNIIFMGGIPGTMVDTRRNAAAKGVFAEYKDIKIIADTPSMWNSATARQKMAEIIAAQGWDRIDGVWTQTGCGEFVKLEVEAGRKDFKPCAGNGTNGFRNSMLKSGAGDGATGGPGVSMGSPPWAAPYAFKLAVDARDGQDVPRINQVPMPLVTNETVGNVDTQPNVFCQKADRAELIKTNYACTAVPLSVAASNFYIDVWSPKVPELDLYSALNGSVPEGQ
ncbi:MAG: substrate-binding domain-containing protein [Xanthobacteraceae bacterium]